MQSKQDKPWRELLRKVSKNIEVFTHSGKVTRGSLFVSLPTAQGGLGNPHLSQALQNGAAYVVAQSAENFPEDAKAELFLRPDVREALGELAGAYFGTAKKLPLMVGVTGTNGKTTICYLLEHLLLAAGRKPGIIGTVSYRWPGFNLDASLTTPGCWQLHELLANMTRNGVDTAVMEVSSHALVQKRVAGIGFDVGLMTNLTQDHLDFHGDMQSYFEAKRLLFTEKLKSGGNAALNLDDTYGLEIFKGLSGSIGFGLQAQEVEPERFLHGEILQSRPDGLRLRMRFGSASWEISSPLAGAHNASNLLAAQAVGLCLGLSPEAMTSLKDCHGAPGRLERVQNPAGLDVFVDYAHTPDALENVLKALKNLNFSSLKVIFGCGGNRDRGKRPLMGQAVAKYADEAILTSDNPRHEDPLAIIEDVKPGLAGFSGLIVEPDRRKAIALALAGLKPGQALLVAGKGHEAYQQIGDVKHPFSDAAVVKELIKC